MRAVIQRVKRCSVSIEGEEVSSIGEGLLILLGVASGDTERELEWMAEKVKNLRIFPDPEGRMNLSVLDISGEVMVVSQFTLLADCRKGRRPSFVDAEDPGRAEQMYERFMARLAGAGVRMAGGVFGAMMDVSLVNSGPVTIVLDTPPTNGV
ncbi:MAG: D-tyrosyl-tRNA(Tyr) deacylase [Actinobacteria bacterium]|nr:D-tyrosyl-tRNA(Tyr) deacylase [Actinomycetota bacterium]MBU1942282.1 D-tyrosyl-tRNA(Tyr) deacylase [Actinomycetota bacterium]MBU2687369.1 D-tyrosyl-tRNA(Tyr) deacylase [Actinomycetota bacterium]